MRLRGIIFSIALGLGACATTEVTEQSWSGKVRQAPRAFVELRTTERGEPELRLDCDHRGATFRMHAVVDGSDRVDLTLGQAAPAPASPTTEECDVRLGGGRLRYALLQPQCMQVEGRPHVRGHIPADRVLQAAKDRTLQAKGGGLAFNLHPEQRRCLKDFARRLDVLRVVRAHHHRAP